MTALLAIVQAALGGASPLALLGAVTPSQWLALAEVLWALGPELRRAYGKLHPVLEEMANTIEMSVAEGSYHRLATSDAAFVARGWVEAQLAANGEAAIRLEEIASGEVVSGKQ